VKRLAQRYRKLRGLESDLPWHEALDPIVENWQYAAALAACLAALAAPFVQFWFIVGPLAVAVAFYVIVGKWVWTTWVEPWVVATHGAGEQG